MDTAGLSTPLRETRDLVTLLPLVSAGELAAFRRVTGSLAHNRLRELRDLGLLEAHRLGCSAQRPQRFHLSLEAQREMGLEQASWHQPGLLMNLLERLPALEAFYRMAAEIRDLGELTGFQWLADDAVAGRALDAAARYEQGWVALMYLGPCAPRRRSKTPSRPSAFPSPNWVSGIPIPGRAWWPWPWRTRGPHTWSRGW